MNEEQYSRANKRVLLAIVVVFGYIAVTLMLALGVSQGGHAAKIVMEAVTAAAVIVISVVAYLGKRTTRTCAVIMTLSMMIGYFVIVQLNTTVGTWTYGLPLLIVAMVYLDKKIVMVTNGIALVSIVVHLVRCFLGDGSDLQNNVIGLFVLLLTAYACNSAEHLLECFFKENLAEIQNASDIQKDSNKKMIIVAENISKHFGEAMDMLDGLQESINVSHSSIQEIADSTESTAEAIQKQAVMCSDIQGNTDQAEQGIKEWRWQVLRLLSGPFRNRAHQKVRENDGLLYPEKKQYWSYVRKKYLRTVQYSVHHQCPHKLHEKVQVRCGQESEYEARTVP